jgi:hypothetical protein
MPLLQISHDLVRRGAGQWQGFTTHWSQRERPIPGLSEDARGARVELRMRGMRAGCLSRRDGALEPPVQPLDHGQLNCLADRPELPGASSLRKK